MLVLLCTRSGDRRTRLGARRQHLGYYLGMRAQRLLSRRGFAAANISACCGWAAATISPCARRGYYPGRAGPRLLSRQGGAAPRLLSRRRLRPGGGRAAAAMHLGVHRGWLRSRLLPRHVGSCATACVSACISARLYVQLVGSARLCGSARLVGSARLWQRQISAAARVSGSLARTRDVEEGKQSCDCAAGAAGRVGRDSARLGTSASPALVDPMTQQSSMPQLCAAR